MSHAFHVWPFNLGPSEGWVFIYLAMAATTIFVFNRVAAAVGVAIDRRNEARAAATADASPIDGDAYRTPGRVTERRLAIGAIPGDDDVWLIAYLRGGVGGVAELLACKALDGGYLAADGDRIVRTEKPAGADAHPFVRELLAELGSGQSGSALRGAAKLVAMQHESDFVDQARVLDLERSESLITGLRAISFAGAALAFVLGAIRIVVRSEVSGGRAPVPAVLICAMLGVVVYAFATIPKRHTESSTKKRYLAWLSDATASLTSDVMAGRRTGREAALAVAVGGGSVLPMYIMVPTAFADPRPVVTSSTSGGSSCGSSSCGSSSCGGGGCGGGGCS